MALRWHTPWFAPHHPCAFLPTDGSQELHRGTLKPSESFTTEGSELLSDDLHPLEQGWVIISYFWPQAHTSSNITESREATLKAKHWESHCSAHAEGTARPQWFPYHDSHKCFVSFFFQVLFIVGIVLCFCGFLLRVSNSYWKSRWCTYSAPTFGGVYCTQRDSPVSHTAEGSMALLRTTGQSHALVSHRSTGWAA